MLGCAVFGAGVIGTVHARNVAAHPRCRLAYVVDQDLGRAEALAGQFGGTAVAAIEPALADDDVAAVIIGSSTAAHEAHVLACAAAGKALLCEKPLSDSLDGAGRCVAAAEQAGVAAAMGLNRRLDAQYRAVFERTAAGEIGDVEMVHVASRGFQAPKPETARLSGGMLREKGAHFYDLAAWIAGAEPAEVYAAGACLIDPGFADYGDVDTAALTLRLDSGALVTFDFGRRSAFGQDELIEVFGSKGMLVTGRDRGGSVAHFAAGTVSGDGVIPGWYERFADSYVAELDILVDAVTARAPVHATLRDGLRAQAVAEAAVRSARTNKPIEIVRIW